MAVYYKPQSPIQSGEDFIYPITTADQVKVDKDTRLNAVGVYLKNIDNSTDTTVYGNNATTLGGVAAEDYALKTDTAPDSSKLGGVAASDYALKTDTAPDSSKLGGKSPEYYIHPRNLLDNSDFRNPVNQRGAGTVTNRLSYVCDRWLFDRDDGVTANATADTNYGWIYMARTSGDSFYSIRQDVKGNEFKNKKFTFAVRCSAYNDTVKLNVSDESWAVIVEQTGITPNENGIALVTFESGDNDFLRLQIFPNGNECGIFWAALYEGSYTADTLPPYVPKGYAAELAECQRYYYRLQNGTNFIFRLRNQHETNNYAAFDICPCITFPVPMRIVPTVSIFYDITDGTLSVGAPFDCSRTSCTVPDVAIPHGGWFDLNSLVASADL